MIGLTRGRYRAREVQDQADLRAAQFLRWRAFRNSGGPDLDRDPYDQRCRHIVIEDRRDGGLVACFRMLPLTDGAEIDQSYSAQFYDLGGLSRYRGRMVEMGRFCIDPERTDPDILRVAWGAMTSFVDREGVEMLFGCSSFAGTAAEGYHDAFRLLRDRHLAPKRWLPRVKAPRVFRFATRLVGPFDRRAALLRMPPLLKTYLTMGGWVSDHAVVDTEMNTLHVFTGVEIKSIPPARARALRAVAG